MSAQLEAQEITMADLITYSVTDAALAELHSKYIGLKVLDAEDEEGYALCKDARKVVRDTRLGVEERRKELKAESLSFGRAVDAEAKRITSKIEAVENHLVEQLKIVDDEKKRREEAALKAAKERLDARIAALQAVKAEFTFDEVAAMPDEAFEEFLGYWQKEYAVDQKREAAEKARLEELENERAAQNALLAAERERVRQLEAEASKMRQEAFERETAELRKAQVEAAAIAATAKAERDAAEAKASAVEVTQAELDASAREFPDSKNDTIDKEFPTLALAWAEIARLRTLLGELATDMGRVLDGPVFNPLGNGGVHPAVRD